MNEPSEVLFSHGTPLHHAVCAGSLATVKALVEAGADPRAVDTAWQGTPLGWAEHFAASAAPSRLTAFTAIAAYLRALR